jgi:MoaA/NifB/PqqE/SkfB family radical SAM enzyme
VELTIDIEITNRCNAKCHFCPRDQTPHQGLMGPDLFSVALARAVEFRTVSLERLGMGCMVSLCGLGEPLLNKHAADYVAQVRAAGFRCSMSSNGSLLSAERGRELVDAGLNEILINVGDVDDEYESVYHLPFEKTRDNIVRFAEIAEGRCDVTIVLVDHHQDAEHVEAMQEYWRGQGLSRFLTFEVMNRGGALFVDHMQYEALPQMARARELLAASGTTPRCGAPFAYLFIGYDGEYYLCCSDWKKETPMGSVRDASFVDVVAAKVEYVTSRSPVCRTCNLDPTNQLADELRALDEGSSTQAKVDELLESIATDGERFRQVAEIFGVAVRDEPPGPSRRLIPVTAD